MVIIIRINGLIKIHNGKHTLNIEQLLFEPGKRYVLLGENGSGKSTLLRILAGIIDRDGGVIDHGDENISVSYMPQKPYSFRMPVWKSVLLGEKRETGGREQAESLLAEIGISRLANQTEAKLSGGEAQRVAFARVMKRRSGLLLLDEPTNAMDREGTALAEAWLKKYMDEHRPTLILATHSAKQAARLGDEAILMRGGVIIVTGTVEKVLAARSRYEE